MATYTVFQHADHDWREACPSECSTSLRAVEADTPKEAMAKWFQPIAADDPDLAFFTQDPNSWQAVAEGVFVFDTGDGPIDDADYFALVVSSVVQ